MTLQLPTNSHLPPLPIADAEAKLAWLQAAWGPPAASGLATLNIGGYVGPSRNVTTSPDITPDMVVESLLSNVAALSTSSPTAWVHPFAEFSAISAFYGVAVHAYEGGPDTSGGEGARAIMALANASLDARMADVVVGIVEAWQSWGFSTFNYFTLGTQPLAQPWGSYTNLFDLKQPDTPKTRGIDRIVNAPPAPLSAGWPAPLIGHNASFFVGYYSPSGLPPTAAVVSWLPENTTMSYLVRFPSACAAGINVTVHMSSTLRAGGDPLEVSVGAFLPPVTVVSPPTSGSKADFVPVTALFPSLPTAALSNGLVTVRLRVPIAGVKYVLKSLDVTCRAGA